jgi:signal peptidase I
MEPSQQPNTQPNPQPLQPSTKGSWVGAFFNNWFVSWILIPVGLVLVLHFFIFSAFHVDGTSMIPTLHNDDYLIVSKVNHTAASIVHHDYIPAREQIIVFHYPKDPSIDFVKRVIGLPGERVVVNNCNVTVYNSAHPNGFDPDNVHLTEGDCTQGDINEVIPAGNLFVLGDNRTPGGSADSRVWGFLPSYDIIGNVVVRLYPFNNFHIF